MLAMIHITKTFAKHCLPKWQSDLENSSKVEFTDKWIEAALRSAELIHSDDFVDCHYADVVNAIMTAYEQEVRDASV